MSHRSDTDVNWAEWQLTCDKARELAATMNAWLTAPVSDERDRVFMDPFGAFGDYGCSSDLVEWCRSARDILEQVANG